MKIGLDLRILERPFPTGVERSWRNLVQALVADPGEDRFVLYSKDPVDLGVRPGRQVQAVPLGGAEPVSLWREMRLAPALKQDRVDLLHSPVAAIPLRTRVPRVATVHELPWTRHPGVEGRGREFAHRLRVRMAVRFASMLAVPSASTERDLVKAHPDAAGRVRVVPHGVDPVFLAAAEGGGGAAAAKDRAARLRRMGLDQGRWFLAVGAARPRKDLPTVLESFKRYRAAGGTAGLALVGPGDPPEWLPEGARVLGFLDDADLAAAYGAAMALVYHSLNEGFGLPVVEAMTLGLPVIAADAGSVAEVSGGAARLVPPGNAAALTAALQGMDAPDGPAAELRAAGLLRAREFRWERATEQVRALWRDALEAPPLPSAGVGEPEGPLPRYGKPAVPGEPVVRLDRTGPPPRKDGRRGGPPSRGPRRGPGGGGGRGDGPPGGGRGGPRREGDASRGPRREGDANRGPRREGDASRGPRRDGDASRGPRREGGADRGPRREGDGSRGPRREGDASRGPRREGDASRGPRREGDANRGPRREGGGDRGPRREGDGSRGPRREGGGAGGPDRGRGPSDGPRGPSSGGRGPSSGPRKPSSGPRGPRRDGGGKSGGGRSGGPASKGP